MSKPDGGPAYPLTYVTERDEVYACYGMSLRAYIATEMMAAWRVAETTLSFDLRDENMAPRACATTALQDADALIAALEES